MKFECDDFRDRHMKRKHLWDDYKCAHCAMVLNLPQEYVKHFKEFHPSEKTAKCPVCEEEVPLEGTGAENAENSGGMEMNLVLLKRKFKENYLADFVDHSQKCRRGKPGYGSLPR